MDVKEFIQEQFQLQDPALVEQLAAISEIRQVPPEKHIYEVGETMHSLVFLASGVVRCFFLDYCGEEFTDCFIAQPGYPLMTPSLTTPIECGLETVVESELLYIQMEPFLPLLQSNLELLYLQNRILNDALYFHWYQKVARYQYSAMQRYQKFLQDYPGLEKVVRGKDIASYLGITPVSLSRLRQEMAKQEKAAPPILHVRNAGVTQPT